MTRTNARSDIPARKRPLKLSTFGVISGRARSAEIQFNAMFIRPAIHCLRDELAAIVDLDRGRVAAHGGDTRQRFDHVFTLQTLADLDGQAFPCVVVDDGQCPKTSSIEQCIGNEIHTPDFVDRGHDMPGMP